MLPTGATSPRGISCPSTTYSLSPANGSGGYPAPPPSPWSFRLIASPTARRPPPVDATNPQHSTVPWVGGGGGGWLRAAAGSAGAGGKQGHGAEGGEVGGQRDLRSAAAAAMACRRLRQVYRQLLAARPELAVEVGVWGEGEGLGLWEECQGVVRVVGRRCNSNAPASRPGRAGSGLCSWQYFSHDAHMLL